MADTLVFDTPLVEDIIDDEGADTPTFTRATVATVVDFEGLTKNCLSGEARFKGARRVENLVVDSDDFSVAGWAKTNITEATPKLTASAANGTCLDSYTAIAGDYVFSIELQRVTGTGNIQIAADSGTYTTVTLTGSYQRFSVQQTVAAGSKSCGIRIVTSGDEVNAKNAQLELVEGQVNQNPSEYVSVFVGTGENISQGTVPTGSVSEWSTTQSANTNITEEGTGIKFATIAGGDTSWPNMYQDFSVEKNSLYKYKFEVVSWTNLKPNFNIKNDLVWAGSSLIGGALTLLNTGTYSGYFYTDDTGECCIGWYLAGGADNRNATLNNISVEKVVDHGANVDGAKYFDTENGNTVSSNVVTEATGSAIAAATLDGVRIEEQRTNLATYSENLSNAAWVATNVTKGSTSVTTPKGPASTTVRLTASAANGTVLQTVTSSSANRAFAVYLKRVTGTGNIDLTVDGGTTWTTKTITSSWARYDINQASVTNPQIGVRIVTNADAIDFWGADLQTGDFITSYIPNLATGSTTRNKDVLLYT